MFHENFTSYNNNFKTHDDSLIILDNFYDKKDFTEIIDFLKNKLIIYILKMILDCKVEKRYVLKIHHMTLYIL